MSDYKECPCGCGRHDGAYCENREIDRLIECSFDPEKASEIGKTKAMNRQSGLNASYYDFDAKSAQELIEYLGLDFSNGNILKSLIRENNPLAKKDTNELYEAEKRYYYAHRHLRSVQKRWSVGGVDSTDAEKGLEEET